jgi:hypothetical protein
MLNVCVEVLDYSRLWYYSLDELNAERDRLRSYRVSNPTCKLSYEDRDRITGLIGVLNGTIRKKMEEQRVSMGRAGAMYCPHCSMSFLQ